MEGGLGGNAGPLSLSRSL